VVVAAGEVESLVSLSATLWAIQWPLPVAVEARVPVAPALARASSSAAEPVDTPESDTKESKRSAIPGGVEKFLAASVPRNTTSSSFAAEVVTDGATRLVLDAPALVLPADTSIELVVSTPE